jgi:hypothetical protein
MLWQPLMIRNWRISIPCEVCIQFDFARSKSTWSRGMVLLRVQEVPVPVSEVDHCFVILLHLDCHDQKHKSLTTTMQHTYTHTPWQHLQCYNRILPSSVFYASLS